MNVIEENYATPYANRVAVSGARKEVGIGLSLNSFVRFSGCCVVVVVFYFWHWVRWPSLPYSL